MLNTYSRKEGLTHERHCVLSQKGGSGKTTLSVHTAVAAEATGERVLRHRRGPTGERDRGRARGKPERDRRHGAGRELDAALRAAEGEGITWP